MAASATQRRHDQQEARWRRIVRGLGFADVATYLTDRHLTQHRTATMIATETGLSRSAVESAFRRHGIERLPHANRRATRDHRANAVAARFGFPSLEDYLADRRAAGLSWRTIAAECGQPTTWLRRRAGLG